MTISVKILHKELKAYAEGVEVPKLLRAECALPLGVALLRNEVSTMFAVPFLLFSATHFSPRGGCPTDLATKLKGLGSIKLLWVRRDTAPAQDGKAIQFSCSVQPYWITAQLN